MEAIRKKFFLLISLVALLLLQTVRANIAAETAEPPQPAGEHFVLVHGACLGAWSWFKLVPLLRAYGHNVTAIDLAASGIDRRQVNDLPSFADYIQPLRDFMASLPRNEKVILVGHSFAGFAISQSMEIFPEKISVAVFVTAVMPGPNYNVTTLNQDRTLTQNLSEPDNSFIYGDGPNNPPTAFIFGPQYLRAKLFQLSPVGDWILATFLVRPLPFYSDQDIENVLMLSSNKYCSVKRVFIISEQDNAIIPNFQRLMIMKNPPTKVQAN